MECINCRHEIMEGAAFCPYCGEKVSGEQAGKDAPIYEADIKVRLKSRKLAVYRDRTEFITSSVQKTVFDYSNLLSVRKAVDHIVFITEDGQKESCPVGMKNVHEAFLYIEKAVRPYIEERKKLLLAKGIQYSLVSSQGLLADGILDILSDRVEFKGRSGQSETIGYQDVKSVGLSAGGVNFSLIDGRTKTFSVEKELREEVLSFLANAIEPYLAERKEALLARGIYYSSFSSFGSENGTLNVLEDRVEFTAKSGHVRTVLFRDVRVAGLYSGKLTLALTDGTSRVFSVDKDLAGEILTFVKNAVEPYVLARTAGFDRAFGIDERIEFNEERGVFHIIRQDGREITDECPVADLVKCQQTECSEATGLGSVVSGGLSVFRSAAKAVGTQGLSETDERISYVGVILTIRTEDGERTECVRFGNFLMGMSRTNNKYDRYVAEISGFMDYVADSWPECELIMPVLPEPEKEPAQIEMETAVPEVKAAGAEEGAGAAGQAGMLLESDRLGIKKYIEGVSRFIGGCTTPMTIAIQGSWGSGRNSILNLLSDHLADRCQENLFWFHTWQFFQAESEEPLSMRIGKKLIAQLGDTSNEELKGRVVLILKDVISIVSQGGTDGQNLMEGFKGKAALSMDNLSETFSKLVQERAGEYGKVVIFIDDLDRLEPAAGMELLEAMRTFFDCEGCVFVIATDYSFVIRGAEERYGQNFDEKKGKSFFDKLFQVSFRVPTSGYDVQNYVKEKLERMEIPIEDEAELGYYVELIKYSVGCEPPSMDRLFNSFLLLKNMANEEMFESRYRRLVLFALLCMQAKFHEIYDYIVRAKDSVTPEFLFGLCSDQSEAVGNSRLSDEEKKEYGDFARIFYDIINTDGQEDISEEECRAFTEVLDLSGITSQ